MRRSIVSFIAALLLVGFVSPAVFAASASASTAPVPRVVFIVGPSGGSTGTYRAQARAAATIARTYTPDVVEVDSPNATWTAVKQALTGASLVVYMGHGNGWPSPYRDAPYPVSQNGFGLNPTAGGDDSAHQYFGESAVGQITLAKNAVVLLNHLCYASGLSEPGLPEGSLDVARQRVDNYAAGFIRAGAAAVIADAWSSPTYLVRAILGGKKSIQSAWQSAPNANGNRIAFESPRSPGYVAQMDMETATSGFSRSIVMKAGLTPADVRAGARGSARGASSLDPFVPTLAGTGIKLASPTIAGLPRAGSATTIDVPFTIANRAALASGIEASVRLLPVEVADAAATVPVDPAQPVDPVQPDTPPPTGKPPRSSDLDRGPALPPAGPNKSKLSIAPPPIGVDLVIPERPGDVVAPVAVKVGKASLAIPVHLPATPGRYRLTITLHDRFGVAYDAATQDMLPSLVVRVTGDFDGAIQVVPTAQVGAGEAFSLGLRVVNLGRAAWGRAAIALPLGKGGIAPATPASVVGRWIGLTGSPSDAGSNEASDQVSTLLPAAMAPGVPVETWLDLTAPSVPGEYLYLLDVIEPDLGSLVAAGAAPTIVRVTVVAPS